MLPILPYRLEGQGYPLLLIHGLGVTYATWQNLAPLLAPHFQLIMVELPGAGAIRDVEFEKPYDPTCTEALEEIRIKLAVEQWAILAYSTGTRVCEAYMQQYPQRVSRAVLLCPFYLRKVPYTIIRSFFQVNAGRVRVVNWLLSDWRLYGWLLAYGFNLKRNEYISDWINEIKLLPVENLKRVITELPNFGRVPFLLPDVPTVPTRFIWASSDAVAAPPSHPRSNDAIIAGCHSAPLLNAHSVAEVVLPFLQEVATKEQRSHHSQIAQNTG